MDDGVSIIILNWNGWKDTIECLESVFQINYPKYEIILIDNGSRDGSYEKLKGYAESKIGIQTKYINYHNEEYIMINDAQKITTPLNNVQEFDTNKKLILIKNKVNYGFAEGNNIGIRYAIKEFNPAYVLLLNNDTVVEKNFLLDMVKVAKQDSSIGIVGPIIYNYNAPKSIQSMGFKIYWVIGAVSPNKVKRVEDHLETDFISGCAMLVRKKGILPRELLNAKYFLYWEDVEFCVRLKKEGYKVVISPQSKIWHKTEGSSKKNINRNREYYGARNLFYFISEHYSKRHFFCFLLGFFSFKLWWYLVSIIKSYRSERGEMVTSFLKGVFDGLQYSKRIMSGTKAE
jgi:GT2 family glycosyltransferase